MRREEVKTVPLSVRAPPPALNPTAGLCGLSVRSLSTVLTQTLWTLHGEAAGTPRS